MTWRNSHACAKSSSGAGVVLQVMGYEYISAQQAYQELAAGEALLVNGYDNMEKWESSSVPGATSLMDFAEQAVPKERWADTTARAAMQPVGEVLTVPSDSDLGVVLDQMTASQQEQMG